MPNKKTNLFNKVAIIGVGLLGGSLGLEIKKRKLAQTVIGCGRSVSNLKIAKKRKLIDEFTTDLKTAVSSADLIVLASPVKTILFQLPFIAKMAKPGSVVIDLGSTKEDILKMAQKFFPSTISFVGCHPMAGTEKKGASASLEGLFAGKKCILTPLKSTPAKVKMLWTKIGAKVEVLSALQHDKIIGLVSHLPQMVAYSLMNAIADETSLATITKFAGSGFRDTTRIAASPAEMWLDIALTNRKNIVGGLKNVRTRIDTLIRLLDAENENELNKFFERSHQIRSKIK